MESDTPDATRTVSAIPASATSNENQSEASPEVEREIAEEETVDDKNYVLTGSAIDDLLRQKRCLVVTLVGQGESGKTSFLASMMLLALYEPMARRLLGSSETLHGLTRLAASVSLHGHAVKPSIQRTLRGDVYGYHASFVSSVDASTKELLFLDLSGEEYRSLATRGINPHASAAVSRADVVTLFFDGLQLTNPEGRDRELSFTLMLLRRLSDSRILNQKPLIIMFSKMDLWAASEEATNFKTHIMTQLHAIFPELPISELSIAAVPERIDDEVEFGANVPEVLSTLFELQPQPIEFPSIPSSGLPKSQFLRFGWRAEL